MVMKKTLVINDVEYEIINDDEVGIVLTFPVN